MEVKLSWIERLMEMAPRTCLPLDGTPKATIYSAIHFNKDEVKKSGRKFRVQADDNTGEEFVCRVK